MIFAEVVTQLVSPHSLKSGGIFIIGQKQDSLDSSGYFNDRKAFSGKVAQIQLWNGQLLSEDIRKMAHCEKESVENSRRIISWYEQSMFKKYILHIDEKQIVSEKSIL